MLSCSGVSKRFPDAPQPALEAVLLAVGERETVAIVGPSGSGKSTLLRVIAGLVDADEGRIVLDGHAMAPPQDREKRRSWHRRVLLLPQDTARTFNPVLRLRPQFRAALKLHGIGETARERDALAAGMLERVGVPADALGRHPDALSGGQRQRAALARLICLRPRLLLADEPTAALDPVTSSEILDLLGLLQGEFGFGLLAATHDCRATDRANRVLRMEAGRLV